MIPATFVGMAMALGSLVAMMLLEGTDPLAVVLLPPLVLVVGATFGAAVAGSPVADLRKLGSWFRLSFAAERTSLNGAPTVGIIGTVVGLVQVLKSLEDPTVLGPLVASAFVATLWGVLSANFVWLPMSVKIRRNADLRRAQMELILEGICEILAGTGPRALRDKLQAMLPPSEAQLSAA